MRKGAEEKFLAAHDKYVDALFRHCYFRVYDRELAKDIVRETFCRTWEFLANGREIENIRAFLYRVLHNLVVDEIRRKKSLSLERLMDEGFSPVDNSSPDVAQHLAAKEVMQGVELLGEPYRSAFVMRYIDELSPKEIARILGESENTVSVRIHRAIQKLRTIIKKESQ